MKELVIKILKNALKKKSVVMNDEEIEKFLEVPPSPEMGDYAFPCFALAKQLKDEPHQIALEVREAIGSYLETEFEDINTNGPYVNFFFNRKNLARKVVWDVITQKSKYGMGKIGTGKKILVEFSSPNIAKPFGVGHLRSTIIGNSIANICEFQGFKTVRVNYFGDWGTQFGKLLLGYDKFGSEKKLQKNPIKHLLEIYVKANKESYEQEARDWFKKLETRDKKSLMLWKNFRDLSLEEFEKLYNLLGIKFDVYDGESKYNLKTKQIIKELQDKKLLKESQGALVVNLEAYKLGTSLIQKSDGATLYATRDIATAISRHDKYKCERMIYSAGQEQKLHFEQFFKILELMGYKWAKNCIHIDHGLYLDKSGKKFATRKGNIVFMEDIIDKTKSLAKKEIQKRFPKLSKKELEKRSLKVALAAIFYGDLKNNRTNNIVFDINRFVSFEGDTGPYIQYSYARATSILKKTKNKDKFQVYNLDAKELELVKKLLEFPDIASEAYRNLSPAVIAHYCQQLSKLFNEFYHACPVIGSEQEAFRLALVEAFRQITKNATNLLGISLLEEM